jgi:BirA family biotin operon repressor/biotin-[acetyl-CoA-carboxylase] ligase
MVKGMQGSRARSALEGSRLADLRWVAETDSTNDDLLQLARAGAPEGIVLVAEHQRAGRGRLDRTWQAPAGSSLLMSILLRPTLPPVDAHLVSTAVACAAVEACTEVTGAEPRLKWPNDLVVVGDDGALQGKLAGILAESIVEDHQLRAVVVGIGINVNWPPDLPADLEGIAVALNHVVGHEVDREDLLVAFVQRLDGWRGALDDAAGRERLVDRYRRLCMTLGAIVRVELHDTSFTGRALDITSEGHLLVDDGGAPHEVIAGDVVHVRAT